MKRREVPEELVRLAEVMAAERARLEGALKRLESGKEAEESWPEFNLRVQYTARTALKEMALEMEEAGAGMGKWKGEEVQDGARRDMRRRIEEK